MKPPKKWKMAVLIWVAIYPTITLLFFLMGEHFATINPLPLRTLVITIMVVPLMVFLIIPALQKVMGNWLRS
jgi:antibiotic biosynthesis monooxygenase (ABM) superfamily enzyme